VEKNIQKIVNLDFQGGFIFIQNHQRFQVPKRKRYETTKFKLYECGFLCQGSRLFRRTKAGSSLRIVHGNLTAVNIRKNGRNAAPGMYKTL